MPSTVVVMLSIRVSKVARVPEKNTPQPSYRGVDRGGILKLILGWLIATYLFLFGFPVPYRTLVSSLTPTTATMIVIHARIKVTLIQIPDVYVRPSSSGIYFCPLF